MKDKIISLIAEFQYHDEEAKQVCFLISASMNYISDEEEINAFAVEYVDKDEKVLHGGTWDYKYLDKVTSENNYGVWRVVLLSSLKKAKLLKKEFYETVDATMKSKGIDKCIKKIES